MTIVGQKIANAPLGSFPVLSDTVGDSRAQIIKLDVGTVGNSSMVTPANPLPVVSVPLTGDLSELIINFNSTGENIVVPGVASQVGRIYKIFFVVSAATTLTFKSSAGGTALTGAMSMLANGGFALDLDSKPWFTTIASGDFIISQTGTAQVSGRVYYTQS